MNGPINEPRRGPKRVRLLTSLFASILLAVGFSAVALESTTKPASAAPISVNQCNNVYNTPGLTVDCDVAVINTLTDSPSTTGSVITTTNHLGATTVLTSTDIVTSVNQCNTSARGGGGTLRCHVNIINNIAVSGAQAATTATVNQCNNNQPDGLGTAPHTCSPVSNAGGATIFQCNNRTGNGGGLVTFAPEFSHCSASGTSSSSLPVTVNQCNEDSADGGGGRVSCTTTITNIVTDTDVTGGTPTGTPTGGTPTGGTGTGGTGTGGAPAIPVLATPKLTG
ncbi:MAG: hypothetical protein WD598_13095 [Acidimicrobiia bacterium]